MYFYIKEITFYHSENEFDYEVVPIHEVSVSTIANKEHITIIPEN